MYFGALLYTMNKVRNEIKNDQATAGPRFAPLDELLSIGIIGITGAGQCCIYTCASRAKQGR